MAQTELSAVTEVWSQLLETVKSQLPEQSYSTWIQPLVPQKLEGRLLHLGAPSKFHREWIEGHYTGTLEGLLKDICGEEIRVRVKVVEGPAAASAAPPVLVPVSIARSEEHQPAIHESHLNPRYQFDAFVEGDSNSFARAACLAIADTTRKSPWNPLLVYGGTGLGKTHLLQAIGNQALKRNPQCRALYVSSEKFTQDFIESVRTSRTTDFSHRYRAIDLLLVDDIQFFATKERTQIEFFHSFNSLYQNGKRIVLTSDRPVAELAGFDKRLISRFGSGLVTNIDPPDYETRVAILLKRAEADGFPLPAPVADLLATHITANVRELEGAYVSLVARCQFSRQPVTLELAREVIFKKTGHPGGRPPVEKIQEAVAEYFHVSVEALRGKSRKKEIVFARMIAMTLMGELTDHSLKTIGNFFGGRDHSTVIHSRDTINGRRNSGDKDVLSAFNDLQRKLSLSTIRGG